MTLTPKFKGPGNPAVWDGAHRGVGGTLSPKSRSSEEGLGFWVDLHYKIQGSKEAPKGLGGSSPQNSETQGRTQEIWVGQGGPTKIRDPREQPGAWGGHLEGLGGGHPGALRWSCTPLHLHTCTATDLHTHTCTATATPARHPYGHTRETHTAVTSHQRQCRGWGGRGDRGGPERGAGVVRFGARGSAGSCCVGLFYNRSKNIIQDEGESRLLRASEGRRREFITWNWVPPLARRCDEVLH